MKKINWKLARLITVILLVVCIVFCLIFQGGAANSIFAIIGGVDLVALLISLIMVKRGKLLQVKNRNFTCKNCNEMFVWDESKIECTCLNLEANTSGNSTFYHYKVAVKWECQCGTQNSFEITLSTRNEKCASMTNLVHEYYLGRILN